MVVSNAAVAEISKRLREASEGEGFVMTIRRERGRNEITAEFPRTWLPGAAEAAWVDALRAWLDNDGSAVTDSRTNVQAALAS